MRILINASNRLGGGGYQVALSIITEILMLDSSKDEFFFICNNIIGEFFVSNNKVDKSHFFIVSNNNYSKLAKELKKIESLINPDVVFSVFGPVYWRPKTKHLVGFANGYYISKNILGKIYSPLQLLKIYIKKLIHIYYMNRDADAIVCETEYVTNEFLKLFKKVKKGYTVSNTYSGYYKKLPISNTDKVTFDLLTVSKYYRHKNLEIINEVSKELKQRGINDVKFILTIDDINYKRLFNNNPYVINKGFVSPSECQNLYENSDAMFLPTLIECFSASYPESMISGKPIITSNFPFAKAICGNAALYINPFDSKDIADKIILLKQNKNIQQDLIQKGYEQVALFPNAKERLLSYLNACYDLVNG